MVCCVDYLFFFYSDIFLLLEISALFYFEGYIFYIFDVGLTFASSEDFTNLS